MEKYIILKSGKRCIAMQCRCDFCKKLFIRVKSNSKQAHNFCSNKCVRKFYITTRVTLECHECGKSFTRVKSQLKNSKSGYFFCCKACKDLAQSLDGNSKGLRPDSYGKPKMKFAFRRKIALGEEIKCVSCGEKALYLLIIHHKDGNRKNNEDSNLEIVCANCHLKRHLKKNGDNQWHYHTRSLTHENC